MHDSVWFTFGLGHWGFGLLFWGLIILVIVSLLTGKGGKDD